MKHICITLFIVSLLSACGITAQMADAPPKGYKEARCTYVDGTGRSGTLTQYAKGKIKMAKLTLFGDINNLYFECTSASNGTVSIKTTGEGDEPETATWQSLKNNVVVFDE